MGPDFDPPSIPPMPKADMPLPDKGSEDPISQDRASRLALISMKRAFGRRGRGSMVIPTTGVQAGTAGQTGIQIPA